MSFPSEQIVECHLKQFCIGFLMSLCKPYITKSRFTTGKKNQNVISSLPF